ncbi:DUF4405 domain-containing protein [Metabacillus sp. RGM 3146]|uniref:DUF4405 domain-containing protein n=1 Tax=Metabacillus sp. RGM 3146 TaxID=3401092 RepID=UPI003B9A8C9E
MKIFDKRLPAAIRFSYILNVLLLIVMIFIMVRGIFISRVVFPNVEVGNEMWFKVTHISAALLSLLLVGIHVGIHWKWVVNTASRLWPVKLPVRWSGQIMKGLTALILIFGIYQMDFNKLCIKSIRHI